MEGRRRASARRGGGGSGRGARRRSASRGSALKRYLWLVAICVEGESREWDFLGIGAGFA